MRSYLGGTGRNQISLPAHALPKNGRLFFLILFWAILLLTGLPTAHIRYKWMGLLLENRIDQNRFMIYY